MELIRKIEKILGKSVAAIYFPDKLIYNIHKLYQYCVFEITVQSGGDILWNTNHTELSKKDFILYKAASLYDLRSYAVL